ncbi:JAB domain-containing protein [Coraliomargarita algicola]|uniref:JAB domain-containing protein n=1 Tax=Coraliomargarita algicola TaxID=3092156 RepID=A0ABZ0RK57_9BACT|nr:JAB domain-containing protein [Coraliomargarita sp. J2-16]WPJ95649.1 JAB domain-containing protein [Coraliomargarita sp. J2-16]
MKDLKCNAFILNVPVSSRELHELIIAAKVAGQRERLFNRVAVANGAARALSKPLPYGQGDKQCPGALARRREMMPLLSSDESGAVQAVSVVLSGDEYADLCAAAKLRGLTVEALSKQIICGEAQSWLEASAQDDEFCKSMQVSDMAVEYLRELNAGIEVPQLWAIGVGQDLKPIFRERLTLLDRPHSPVAPARAFRAALDRGARGVVVVRVHPADSIPNEDDARELKRLLGAAAMLGSELIDFIVMNPIGNCSSYYVDPELWAAPALAPSLDGPRYNIAEWRKRGHLV